MLPIWLFLRDAHQNNANVSAVRTIRLKRMPNRLALNVEIPRDRIGFAQLAAIMRPARLLRLKTFDERYLWAVGPPRLPMDDKCAIDFRSILTHLDGLVPG